MSIPPSVRRAGPGPSRLLPEGPTPSRPAGPRRVARRRRSPPSTRVSTLPGSSTVLNRRPPDPSSPGHHRRVTTAREPVELPAALVKARVFSLADAAAQGLDAADLRRARPSIPRPGVRSIEPATSGILACRAALAVAPTGSAISHFSAGRLHHLPLPDTAPDDGVHVMLPAGHRRLRRQGIVEHRGVESRRIVRVGGVPATGLADTWADLAGVLELRDLVAVGDAIANREGGLDALREGRRGPGECPGPSRSGHATCPGARARRECVADGEPGSTRLRSRWSS